MRLPLLILGPLRLWAERVISDRGHDFAVTRPDGIYLRRWFVTPWSAYDRRRPPATAWERLLRRLPNIYIHEFLGSDDDRALHDHPWWNLSILLSGAYNEHTIAAGGVHHVALRHTGEVKLRPPGAAHRIALIQAPGQPRPWPCLTLFITGPTVREWGFHCPAGWRPWRDFVDARDSGKIGRGCG